MPARTIEPATPTPVSPTPKSSAAKLTVWVNSVLTNADDIDAAASRPSTVSARGSRRSGGAHHGVGRQVVVVGVGRAPRPGGRAPSARGRANSHANHGSDQPVARRLPPPSIAVGADRGQRALGSCVNGPSACSNVAVGVAVDPLLEHEVVARALQDRSATAGLVGPLPRRSAWRPTRPVGGRSTP